MLNFSGSNPNGRCAEIHDAPDGYSVYIWIRQANHNSQWQEVHGLSDWLTAFGIASKWLDNDFTDLH